ncbi:MAG: hypothetical protein ACREQO_09030 [Candidatus Binatia bacterium]
MDKQTEAVHKVMSFALVLSRSIPSSAGLREMNELVVGTMTHGVAPYHRSSELLATPSLHAYLVVAIR